MAGEKEIKKATEAVGADVAGQVGKQFEKISQDVATQQLMPKNALGMSDAMVEGMIGAQSPSVTPAFIAIAPAFCAGIIQAASALKVSRSVSIVILSGSTFLIPP